MSVDGASSLSSLISHLKSKVDGIRAFELLSLLSRIHRIQGSREIVVASEYVASILDEHGVEYEFEKLSGPIGLHEKWGFWEPRGWILEKAELLVEGKSVASTAEHPLIAVAHTPPGEIEARASERLVFSPSLLEAKRSLEEGEVIITKDFNREFYWRLEKEESKPQAIIAYHEGPGIRYYALFPPYFINPPITPVLSLDKERALTLRGKQLKITVNTKYVISEVPIIHAWLGSKSDPGVLLIAHICHPKPGAHDNASGVAALVETLLTLKSYESNLKKQGISIHGIIAPEYTGLAAAFTIGMLDPSNYMAAVSIDMVGADFNTTGGAPLYYHSLYVMPSILDPVLSRALWKSFSELHGFSGEDYPERGVNILHYSWGSDHDIAASMGIPSSLVNDWPDKYYHTSLDVPSNISVENLSHTITALAASILYVAQAIRSWKELLEPWIDYVLSELVLKARLEGKQLNLEKLAALRKKQLENAEKTVMKIKGLRDETTTRQPKIRGPISSSYLQLVAKENIAGKLLSLKKDERETYLAIAPITASALGSLEDASLEVEIWTGRQANQEIMRTLGELIGLES